MKTEIENNCNKAMSGWKLIDEYSYAEPPYRPEHLEMSVGENRTLKAVKGRVDESVELHTLWACSNVVAMGRLGYSDHGMKHVEIVARHAQKILRLLYDAGVKPSCMRDHGMSYEDAETIIFLGACLHDIGHSIHRDSHSQYGVWLAMPLLEKLLDGIYSRDKKTIINSEVLHCIAVHHKDSRPLTLEAGVLRVSDALDMAHGRTRLWDDTSNISNIHAISARAIQAVEVSRGKTRPVSIGISMSGSAGVFQVDELLRPKLAGSGIQDYVQVDVKVNCEKGLAGDFTI
jgi:metal-dependent HD superfamily phosphatase/phosphodiesterase